MMILFFLTVCAEKYPKAPLLMLLGGLLGVIPPPAPPPES